jgi:uncharacterized protein
MAVIDVDAHFEPGPSWLEGFPDLKAKIPEISLEHRFLTAFESLLSDVPRDEWPPLADLIPPGLAVLRGDEKLEGFEDADMFPVTDAATRLAWLDEVGIDMENVICLEGLTLSKFLEGPTKLEALHACNDWLASNTGDVDARLMPVTAVDLSDLDHAIAEMTQMRSRGSRSFLIQANPVNGVPLMHPHFDRIWSAATDLGMVAMLHVGYAPSRFDRGWANTGGDMYAFRQISLSQGHQSAQVLLNALVFGGVFERFPKLTVLLCELNIGWLPYTVEHMDWRTHGEVTLFTGEYSYPMLPSEYIRRNVRITPIPRPHQSPIPFFDALPECIVFSSDYPHFEGSPEPTAFYDGLLAGVSPSDRMAFLGGNIAQSYERMGDPLPLAKV